jgi:hypothetical protein
MGLTDVYMMSKGSAVTAINAKTATTTSDPIHCKGYNAILVYHTTSVAKNWTIKVQGCDTRNGTYLDVYEQANTGVMVAMSYQTNASRIFLFKGIPDWIKIVATKGEDGATVTVKVQPLNC